ncbi:uncharacterized protein EAF01_002388 [Botrytis porri]|uniref:uncharacterized protein n=1 Tax=Botrytis porri TaxID=87229 RepID=UPI0018FF7091|nr:uncharacterized protein EAF01_002388 [Botrytis porri]KAF7910879.1 hypothetical protein EAF01_002388 [Botrytis porri]
MASAKEPEKVVGRGSIVKDAVSKLGKGEGGDLKSQSSMRIETLRLSSDIEPPTPIQAATINSFASCQRNIFLQALFGKTLGYAVPVVNEVLLAHIESNKINGSRSAALDPTVLVILPTG